MDDGTTNPNCSEFDFRTIGAFSFLDEISHNSLCKNECPVLFGLGDLFRDRPSLACVRACLLNRGEHAQHGSPSSS
jgi:hypothetical protein